MTDKKHSEPPSTVVVEDDRTSMHPTALRRAFLDHLAYLRGRVLESSTPLDCFNALAYVVRDRMVARWAGTRRQLDEAGRKRVYYLSAEFLLGRLLASNLHALGMYDEMQSVLAELGVELADLLEREPDAGLGNGGLGRLAACFLDSMATIGLNGYGYGIRYEFGIFKQSFKDGWQHEQPDEWLKFGNPWEIVRPEQIVEVNFYGRCVEMQDASGRFGVQWVDTQKVLGVPYDTLIAGYGNDMVNTLRLWQARSGHEFDFKLFNDGDYVRAVEDKNASEVISKVLYPNDHNQAGRELRLKQEYFFVACSIHDIVRRHLKRGGTIHTLSAGNAIQLNDTHPAIAVAELMRLLVDEYKLDWDAAWEITVATLSYTNHTLLAEALEKWSVALFERLLPRHLQIIFEINRRFLRQVSIKFPGDDARLQRMSLIEEGTERRVRMAYLAVVGTHAVNGVAALHTRLLKQTVLKDFAECYPERFSNKTNGVTPRRWLMQCNPRLARFATELVGDGWQSDLDRLDGMSKHADDPQVLDRLAKIKYENKRDFADFSRREFDFEIDPDTLFDVQIKRLHEYKRQLLNGLHIARLYLDLKKNPEAITVPRTFLFGAKAAPGYRAAKLIIKLINSIGEVVNQDPDIQRKIRVLFVPNYRVSIAERIIPAADLSEQISTAGKEASGTGNMKFALNGALTIGTLDGANIEIRDAVGEENFFLFGLDAEQIEAQRKSYRPRDFYEQNPRLREVLDLIASGFFDREHRTVFHPLLDELLSQDAYFLLADWDGYLDAQQRASALYQDTRKWQRSALYNISKNGRFSSDRTIREYAREIWHAL
ncbi:MAG: glycogen/starch/alpha-glucan phosphorylase [Deltaproteobacteria bacterium]|nr:glycogen/starch/alpha-glucan phosphorylase [Deltaproteobacteria bacterium]